MRAWQIENWTQKKLRVKTWNASKYAFINGSIDMYDLINWNVYDNGRLVDTYTDRAVVIWQLFSSNDVEEFVELKACSNCGDPCKFWLKGGHCQPNLPCWTAPAPEEKFPGCKGCKKYGGMVPSCKEKSQYCKFEAI